MSFRLALVCDRKFALAVLSVALSSASGHSVCAFEGPIQRSTPNGPRIPRRRYYPNSLLSDDDTVKTAYTDVRALKNGACVPSRGLEPALSNEMNPKLPHLALRILPVNVNDRPCARLVVVFL